MKRTELRRGASTLRRTRLRPQSKKRKAEADAYLDARMAVNARDGGRCVAARLVPEVGACWGPNDPHHVHPVGAGGPRCELRNMITTCRASHDWIHANTAAALERGLLAGKEGVTFEMAEERRARWPLT